MKFFNTIGICAFLLLSVCVLSGHQGDDSEIRTRCCGDDTVLVTGQARIEIDPDIAILNVGISVTAKTSQEATEQVAQKIHQVLSVLSSNSIDEEDIQTLYLNVNPQYSYQTGRSQVIGHTARQTLKITVRNIQSDGSDLGQLIDQLTVINGIEINGLQFDKEDKTLAIKQSRKLAFENAKEKAKDLAQLADRDLGRVIKIVDTTSKQTQPVPFRSQVADFAAKDTSTSISVGKIVVSYSLQVKFGFK